MSTEIKSGQIWRPVGGNERGVRVRVFEVDAIGMVTFHSVASGRKMPRTSIEGFRKHYAPDDAVAS